MFFRLLQAKEEAKGFAKKVLLDLKAVDFAAGSCLSPRENKTKNLSNKKHFRFVELKHRRESNLKTGFAAHFFQCFVAAGLKKAQAQKLDF